MVAAKPKHIADKGAAEALLEAMTGRVNVFFSPLGVTMPLRKDGRALGLAVTPKARNRVVPEVPAVAEAVLPEITNGFEVTGVVPAPRTPQETRQFVARELKSFADVAKAANIPKF